MNNTPDWQVLYQKSEKFSSDTFEFIFNEANEFLSANIGIAESFKTRSVTALSFLTPTILAIIGYLVLLDSFPTHIIIPVGASLTFLMASAYYCLEVINKKSSYFRGCKPSFLLKVSFVDDAIKQKHDLFFTQCEEYEKRISQRMEENDRIGESFRMAVNLMIIAPLTALILFLLILGLRYWYPTL